MKSKAIPFINNKISLITELNLLYQKRLINKEKQKQSETKRKKFSLSDKETIFHKTNSVCHICGIELDTNTFQIDHIKAFSSGGKDTLDNFLPICPECNNYKWDYSPEEIQWILKLGVWLKTKIQDRDLFENEILEEFLKDERKREKRRKNPRQPYIPQINFRDLFPVKGKFGSVKTTYNEINRVHSIIEKYIVHIDSDNFKFINKSFLFTGKTNINRNLLEKQIQEKKGIIKTSISGKLDYLIIGNFYGLSKILKVDELNKKDKASIKIITCDKIEKIFFNKIIN